MDLRNLLVPTDFSDEAHASLVYALALAKDFGARLFVLHSYYIPVNTLETDYVADQALWLEQARQRAEEEMQLLEENYLKNAGVPYCCLVNPGPTSSDLNDTITENDIGLVVMSPHDNGKLENFFGSLYSYAIRHAKAPVLLVPEGSRYQRPQKLVFATDLKPYESTTPVEMLRELALHLQAEVVLLHVHEAEEKPDDKKDAALQQLQQQLAPLTPRVRYDQSDDTEEGIFRAAHQEGAQWLLAIAHQYGLLEGLFHSSLTKKLAQDTNLPLLVSHE